jgi:hypothetical protein
VDPNAILREIIELACTGEDPDRMAELAEDLAEWLKNGGFRPSLIEAIG